MGRMFLSSGIEDMLMQKNVELSQISLDDSPWIADISM